MKTATALTAAVLLAVAAGVLFAQAPAPLPVPGSTGAMPFPLPGTTPAVPAPEPTVDQLLDELGKVQAEKEALAKKEQELMTAIRAKLAKQSERMKKLGVILPEPPRPVETPKPPAAEFGRPDGGLPPIPAASR